MSDKDRLTIKIDAETKKDFKIIALRKGTTMSDILENEVKKYVEEYKKENKGLL